MQLFFYEYLNKRYKQQKEMKLAEEGKIVSFDAAVKVRVEELIVEKLKTKDVDNGEDLTPDEIAEIHHSAMSEIRDKMNLNMRTRNKRGDIEDYLETLSWGSTPEYLAFAIVSGVSIKVYVPKDNKIVLRDSVENGPETISLLYTNHHYDVIEDMTSVSDHDTDLLAKLSRKLRH
jgi:hypothetical protein